MINFLNESENKFSTEFEKRGYIVKNIKLSQLNNIRLKIIN
jgi:hypothetical protein